jgi:hypothetical protein
MRALTSLQKSLEGALSSVHKFRLATLWLAVEALLIGEKLTLTHLGSKAPSEAFDKHRIKRMCRFLGNKRMHGNLVTVYRGAAELLFKENHRPLLLVDWTPVGNKRVNHALAASTPIGGRAVMIYAEVHPEKRCGSPRVEKQFLVRLQAVLPPGCKPIIVTDAGFRTPWFDAVEALGWDFVGRLRHRTLIQRSAGKPWVKMQALFSRAKTEAVDLGQMILTRSAPRLRRLVIIKAKRGAKRVKKTPRCPYKKKRDYTTGEKSKPRQSERHRLGAREPWLLVTSMNDDAARRIVNIYKTRMQTEETFRDLKSHRFGWSFDESRTTQPKRIETLLLIASVAAIALLLAGIAAEQMKLHWKMQANTVRNRRVLSLLTLGRRVIQNTDEAFTEFITNNALKPLQALILTQVES